MVTPDMKKLDMAPEAEEQWKDADLEDILALISREYSADPAQPALQDREAVPSFPEETPEAREEPGRRTMELPDLKSLLSWDEEPEAPRSPEPLPREEDPAPREEFIPVAPAPGGFGEEPDFDETPAAPVKKWPVAVLSALAVAEVAAIVAIVLWWRQWIL